MQTVLIQYLYTSQTESHQTPARAQVWGLGFGAGFRGLGVRLLALAGRLVQRRPSRDVLRRYLVDGLCGYLGYKGI